MNLAKYGTERLKRTDAHRAPMFGRGPSTRRLCSLAFAFTVCFTGVCAGQTPARAANEDNKALARTLAAEGAKAFKAGHWAEAIEHLTRAEQAYHAPTHLLYVARSYEKLGKLILAQDYYLRIMRDNLGQNAPPAWREAQRDAKAELIQVEKRIPSLAIELGGGEEGLGAQVILDGQPLEAALIGVGRPADPGEHHVEVKAEGWQGESLSFTIEEGVKRTVTLNLVPLPKPEAKAPSLTRSEPRASDNPTEIPVTQPGAPAVRVASYILGGLAVGAGGAGVYFFLKQLPYARRADSADAQHTSLGCKEDPPSDPQRCSELAQTTYQNDNLARPPYQVALGLFIGGGAALVAGTTLFLLSQPSTTAASPTQEQGLTVRPWVSWGSAGLYGKF